MLDTVVCSDALTYLRTMPDESVHCCITSPPYFGLRDYGVSGQIGLEETPQEYVARLAELFHEIKRVLRSDGTCWLNLGDSYAGSGVRSSNPGGLTAKQTTNAGSYVGRSSAPITPAGCKPKDLMGIPWRVAFALQDAGWYLRSDIIWNKPNPMPESVRDRPTRAHEYVFLLTKSAKYWYDADAIREPLSGTTLRRDKTPRGRRQNGGGSKESLEGIGYTQELGNTQSNSSGRNKRSVWTVTPKPFRGAHFATFPPDLIEPMVLAGCPDKTCSDCGSPYVRVTEKHSEQGNHAPAGGDKAVASQIQRESGGLGRLDGGRRAATNSTFNNNPNKRPPSPKTIGWKATCECNAEIVPGVVLDPFGGSGTTGLVAKRHNRHFTLLELNPTYATMAHQRISAEFSDVQLYTPEEI